VDRRVVIATLQPDTHGGTGVQTHFRQVARHLRSAGVPVEIVTPFSAERPLVYPVFAVRRLLAPLSGAADVWWYRTWHARFLRRALRRVLATGPAVVYAQDPLAARAAAEAGGPDVRVVLRVHFSGSEALEWASRGRIAMDGRLARSMIRSDEVAFRRIDGVVFVSEAQRAEVLGRYPSLAAIPGWTIPNAVEEPPRVVHGEVVADAVTVGALEPRKNQRFLLEVCAAARDAGSPFSLTVVGDGPDRGPLERAVADLGLRDLVTFAGFVADVAPVLAGHRLYVHAATQETFGLALVEAMAVGLPVVAPPTGGIPELVHDGVEGILWDLGDPTGAARIVTELLGDDARRREMAAAGRLRYTSTYTPEAVMPMLLEVLRV